MAKGYVIARVRVTDAEQYAKYRAVSPDAIAAAFGGKFIVRGGKAETVEGEADDRRVIVVEFPSYETAREFYYSDVYQEAKRLREHAGEGQFTLVEGWGDEEE